MRHHADPPPQGLVDVDAEVKAITKKAGIHAKSIEALEAKMAVAGYADKVPQQVQEQNSQKLASLKEEHSAMMKALEQFELLR